jgi:hypothetical protein
MAMAETEDTMLDAHDLKKTHDKISTLLRFHPSLKKSIEWEPWSRPEPYEAALAAERLRDYWKPSEVKLILVAESHLYTDADDLVCRIDPAALPVPLPGCPSEYVRLVYCLGYGENSVLVANRIPAAVNPGTDDYWAIFSKCADTWTGSTGNLTWKIQTLKKLQGKGIWLLDASIHACCNPRLRGRPSNLAGRWTVYRSMLQTSWEYVSKKLEHCENIWCIGRNVKNAIPDPRLVSVRTIPQPSSVRFGLGAEYVKGLDALVTAARSL